MGLGRLLTRSTEYTVKNTVTGATQVFTVTDNMAPDWASFDPYRGGMTIPGTWRAALCISDLLGGMPWDAYREIGGQPITKLQPRPPLLEQPNPPNTRMTTFSSWTLDLLWHGNAIGVIAARSPLGWPTAVVAVPADCVGVRRVQPWSDSNLPVGAIEYAIGDLRLESQDVIHVMGPCRPGAVRGMGILELHFETLNLMKDQQRQAGSVSRHGVPTGLLKSSNPDLTGDEAAELKAAWLASQGTRTVAVLNATTEFQPLAWTPEDMEMIAARKFSLNEAELLFGLPVGWLGGSDSSRKYANMSQDDLALLKYTLGGHVARFEQTLTLHFPRGTCVKANLDWLLRPDTLSRYQAHAIAGGGKPWLTVDEIRAIEDLGPMPEEPEPEAPPLPPVQAQASVGAPPAEQYPPELEAAPA